MMAIKTKFTNWRNYKEVNVEVDTTANKLLFETYYEEDDLYSRQFVEFKTDDELKEFLNHKKPWELKLGKAIANELGGHERDIQMSLECLQHCVLKAMKEKSEESLGKYLGPIL